MRDFPGIAPGPLNLVIRAIFVPDGDAPPAEFLAGFPPIRIRASYDPDTGSITCESGSIGFGQALQAHWYPDNDRTVWDDEQDFEAWAQSVSGIR